MKQHEIMKNTMLLNQKLKEIKDERYSLSYYYDRNEKYDQKKQKNRFAEAKCSKLK